MPELGIIALTPAAWTGNGHYPGVAISAARSGAIGILDLEYLEKCEQAELALTTLLQEGIAGGVGIRCGVEQVEEFQPLIRQIATSGAASKWIILAVREKEFDKKSLSHCISSFGKKNLQVACEAIDLTEAKLAQQAGAALVIAKGHESAGRVGAETSFVLLQRFRKELSIPVWVRGGIGPNTASAALAAGCAGVVLDSQLLLCRESPLSIEQKEKLSNFDGTETELFGIGADQLRIWVRPGAESLRVASLSATPGARASRPHLADAPSKTTDSISKSSESSNKNRESGSKADDISSSEAELRRRFRNILKDSAECSKNQLPAYCALGQDVAFAFSLSSKFVSVAAVLAAVQKQALENLRLASQQETLAQSSPFAVAHGCTFPIVQGAMTRVSDTAEFAQKVAEGGGLPFLALALMRKDEIEPLLEQSQQKLAGLPWGVGMLGFVPPELRQEQLQLVLKYRPPCALIAGGRPDQAKELESAGIKTYLHVPSPALLESFVELGARRFIFEGKECGGHVGPRSSFVLWESMIETLLQAMPTKSSPSEFHVVFAGGIHDKVSSAMVATLAATLVERGVRVGVLMGTAYLFTKEAVASGAIVPKFQEAALRCEETVLLETGPGHAIRCVNSPYKEVFDEKRKKMEADGYGKNELREELELMNLGRLRVASKGLARGDSNAQTGSKLVKVSSDKQWSDGMYMIGQVAAMHDKTTTIKDLHDQVSNSADEYLKSLMPKHVKINESKARKTEDPIAIIGMSCLFPKANDLESFWQNILNKVDCIEEVPLDQWDSSLLYSNDPLARDKVYSKWGGFLRDVPFDPSVYGIPPSSLASIDPMQLLILEVTRAALHDAGYQTRPFPKEKTSIVLANAGHGPITAFYSLRSMLDWTLSDLDPAYRKVLEKRLPEWTEDSFPGYLGNVVAGRVANRFDLGGVNFCVDAACASSLAALYTGIRELRAGSSDMVLLAATDTHNQPGDYLSFSKTHALSPRGRCRTFDATADGIVISEGMAVVVLKRLADAERDGDRVYALIKGIGGSSDGRDLSLTAPRPAGQMLALTRAYEDADLSPATVELVEAHGTGTVAGDKAEIEALRNVFESAGADKRVCAIGSVKTMVGHTKCAAGLASIIKISRSLYHKILPPTMGVETPSPACNFEASPFYLNTDARPWVHDSERLGYPRRAGVSAFGFGGTNFHAVLEEYAGQTSAKEDSALKNWPSEIFTFKAGTRVQLQRSIEALENGCKKLLELEAQAQGPVPSSEPSTLLDLAYRQHLAQNSLPGGLAALEGQTHISLAIVASSALDLSKKLEQVKALLQDEGKTSFRDPRGLFFEEKTVAATPGLVAFLFPGQGSQQLNMLRDLSLCFGDIRRTFERSDRVLADKFDEKLSRYVFPNSAFIESERQKQQERLTDTHVAQPAVAAADMAALSLLTGFGLKPDMCAGHSFGEYVALAAAGVMSQDDLFKISEKRGAILKSANEKSSGSMTAVSANGDEVRKLIAHLSNVTLANINSPRQCIISGESTALAQASRVLDENKVKSRPIAVSAAFHSPLMEPALKQLAKALLDVQLQSAQIPVYSNTLAKPYPSKPSEIASLLCEHLVKPVEFQRQIEQMHEAGARIFIECGPGSILTGLVGDILEGKEHLCLSLERNGKNGLTQLQYLLAQAFIAGLELDFGKLYRNRVDTLLSKKNDSGERAKPKLTYLINGAHIKRYDGKIAVPSSRPTEQALRVAAAGKAQAFEGGSSISSDKAMNNTATNNTEAKTSANNTNPATANRSHPHPVAQTVSPPVVQSVPQLVAGRAVNAFTKGAEVSSSNHTDVAAKLAEAAANLQRVQTLPGLAGQGLNAPVPPSTSIANSQVKNSRELVMLEFQRSMTQMTNNFLQTQERVMLAYLQQSALGQSGSNVVASNTSGSTGSNSGNGSGIVRNDVAPLPSFDSHPVDSQNSQATDPHFVVHARVAPEDTSSKVDEIAEIANDNDSPKVTQGNDAGAAASGKLDSEALIAKLIQIVSDRTGYPSEMLDPSLDLEADLGIDSIKRVEILNSFRKLLPEEVQIQLESGIEKLAGTRTLQGIMDWIRNDLVNGSGTGLTSASQSERPDSIEVPAIVEAKAKESNSAYVARALVQLRELPLLSIAKPELSGLYVITDSEDGLAETLSAKLVSAGAETLILRHRDGKQPEEFELPASRLEFDLCREDLIHALAEKISEKHDKLGGLVHLLPLHAKMLASPSAGANKSSFSMVRSLLLLSRELLIPQNIQGKVVKLFAATSLGGKFGLDGDTSYNPVQAAVPGLLKTYAREYPDAHVRALDFASSLSHSRCADMILSELGYVKNDGLVEVAYSANGRFTVEETRQELEPRHSAELELNSSSVVLVTGGARGITAELCLELAERHKPSFVILGRGVKPSEPEDIAYKGLTSQKEIKLVIMDKLRQSGGALSVPAIEGVYQRLVKEREIRQNLSRIEAAGSRVHYYSLDVRDESALAELVDRLYDSFGKIDAVIHGAGVIEDSLIKDKSLASFDRVFGTKVESALTLAARLQLDKLKYFILFSSVVGRTGNAGQVDYVAANEVLNKLAHKLNHSSKARVLSIGWGPWRGGMAQPELESVFARYGWSMIEARDGRAAFYDELRLGLKGTAEVLLVGQIQSKNHAPKEDHEVGQSNKEIDKRVSVAQPSSGAANKNVVEVQLSAISGKNGDRKNAGLDEIKSGNGNGNGNGNGDRDGRGNVDRNGHDNGNGHGDLKRHDNGNGNGDHRGQGNGNGNGDHSQNHNGHENGNGHGNGGGSHNVELVRARGARLNRAEILKQDSKHLQLRLRLDPEFDLYLKDHSFEGMPVLPMAVASELIAETAQFMYPDWHLARLENLDIPSGIMFDNGAKDLYLNLTELSRSKTELLAELTICTNSKASRKNFVAQAVLSKDAVVQVSPLGKFSAQYKRPHFADLEASPPSVKEVYSEWLFHGPLFQGIDKIEEIGRDGISGVLNVIPLIECLRENSGEEWLIDPILLDSAMQLAGIWARHYMGVTALPTGFKSLHLISPARGQKFSAIIHIPEESKNGHLRCDLAIYDESGKLVVVMEDLGGVGSKALNRLGIVPKALRAK